MDDLLRFTNKGIYCSQGDFYIDPWKPVQKAIVTHGHSDHAHWGSTSYLTHTLTKPIMKFRLGNEINVDTIDYGEKRTINGVTVSLHPAGHTIGSAQIRVEYKGDIWVVSGDYKVVDDGISGAFEPVKCNTFITESTFGLPIYKWKPQETVYQEINDWWKQNASLGKTSVIAGYALGKAQRILAHLDLGIGPVYLHGAIYNINSLLIDMNIPLPPIPRFIQDYRKKDLSKALIIAPPSALGTAWQRRFYPSSIAMCSGWMALRGAKRRRAVDRGFVLSDHCDWNELNQAVKATGAERIIVTHGYVDTYSRWLNDHGYKAEAKGGYFARSEDENGELETSKKTEE